MTGLQLDDLGAPNFWGQRTDKDQLRVTFVLPTGRAAESSTPHLALVSDALLLPEIALAFADLARAAGLPGVAIESALDIDIAEQLREADAINTNMVVLGSADVNVVAKLLLDRTGSFDAWHAGFMKPYDVPAIMGAKGKLHMFTTSPRTGLLALYDNPWSESKAVAILSAGLFAVGSVASNRLLLNYLEGKGAGNNSYSPDLPMKLVNGIVARYPHVELKSIDDCVPPMDLVNISGVEVLE
jgi:hypothetical protein